MLSISNKRKRDEAANTSITENKKKIEENTSIIIHERQKDVNSYTNQKQQMEKSSNHSDSSSSASSSSSSYESSIINNIFLDNDSSYSSTSGDSSDSERKENNNIHTFFSSERIDDDDDEYTLSSSSDNERNENNIYSNISYQRGGDDSERNDNNSYSNRSSQIGGDDYSTLSSQRSGDEDSTLSSSANDSSDNENHDDDLDLNDTAVTNQCTKLLSILDDSNSPLYLFDKVIDWVRESMHLDESFFKKKIKRRKFIINKLVKKFKLEGCIQKESVILLQESKIRLPVIRASNMESLIKSILHNLPTDEVEMMNYVDNDDILESPKPPNEIDHVSELHTAYWFSKTFHSKFSFVDRRGVYKRKSAHKNSFLLPVIIQIDELKIDNRGKIKMEPVLLSLSLPKRKLRNLPSAWRPIGYIPSLEKNYSDYTKMNFQQKLCDYNQILAYILEPLAKLQEKPFDWTFVVNDKTYNVKCYIEVQFLMGDCVGNDKPCGRKGGYNSPGGICRMCNTPLDKCDKLDTKYKYHDFNLIKGKTDRELQKIGMYKLTTYAFEKISFGYLGKGNIHMASPNGPLHQIKEEGLFKRALTSMYEKFNECNITHRTRGKITLYEFFQEKMQTVSDCSSRMSTEKYPRLKFKQIDLLTSGAKGDDSQGLLLIAFITLYTSCSFESYFTNNKMKKYYLQITQLLHDLLLFHRWLILKKTRLSPEFFYKKHNLLVEFMKRTVCVINREEGNQLRIPKIHQLVHCMYWNLNHGSWLNLDEGIGERNLRYMVKSPAQKTQRRHESINFQSSNRFVEELAVLLQTKKAYRVQDGYEEDDLYFEDEFAKYSTLENAGYDDQELPTYHDKENNSNNEDPRDSDSESDSHSQLSYMCETKGKYVCRINKEDLEDKLEIVLRNNLNVKDAQEWWGKTVADTIKEYMDEENIERIICFTEAKVNGRDIYRVHKNYQRNGIWQNFVEVKYEIENDSRKVYPARLETIFQYNNNEDTFICISEMENTIENQSKNERSSLNISICERMKLTGNAEIISICNLRGNTLVIPDGQFNSKTNNFIHVFKPSTWGVKFANIQESTLVNQEYEENYHQKLSTHSSSRSDIRKLMSENKF